MFVCFESNSLPLIRSIALLEDLTSSVSSESIKLNFCQNRLYFLALQSRPSPEASTSCDADGKERQIHYFCIDNELVYWNFFLDFGPLNLGQLYRFCTKLNQKLNAFPDHVICFISCNAPAKRANAVCLICSWQVLYLNRLPEDAFNGFCLAHPRAYSDPSPTKQKTDTQNNNGASKSPLSRRSNPSIAPLPPFHDASPCACSFDLSVLDCLRGLAKARRCKFFDFESFDVDEYEHFEQVEVSLCTVLRPCRILCVRFIMFISESFQANTYASSPNKPRMVI